MDVLTATLPPLLHTVVLVLLCWFASARLFRQIGYRLAAVFLLGWTNLVGTALLLSVISRLDSGLLYFLVSAGLASAVYVLTVRTVDHPTDHPRLETDRDRTDSRWPRHIRHVAYLAVVGAVVFTVFLGLSYVPNNWDSLAYRFPRAFFFLEQGNLLHTEGAGTRARFYPFNASLIYLYLARYRLSYEWWNLVSVLAWLVTGLGTALYSRLAGSSRTGTAIAAALGLGCPIVLCLANSTNDELLVAAPLLLGAVFGVAWWRSRQRRFLVLASLGVGLGMGTKFHWVFLGPFLAVLSVILVVRFRAWRIAWPRHQIGTLAACLLLVVVLFAPFLAINYHCSGELTPSGLSKGVLNQPFRFDVALQTIGIHSAQLFLAPIPDLDVITPMGERPAMYQRFNDALLPALFPDSQQGLPFTHPPYTIRGIADPIGWWYFEQTLWMGFIPHVLLLMLLIGIRRNEFSGLAKVVALSIFAWHLGYAGLSRYSETTGTYYAVAAVLGFAALGPAWDAATRGREWWRRLYLAVFCFLFLSHLLFAVNIALHNAQRNLPGAWKAGFRGEDNTTRVPDELRRYLEHATHVHIPYTRWELLYWNYMRLNPAAKYTTGRGFNYDGREEAVLFDFESFVNAGMVPMQHPGAGQLTYFGPVDRGIGNAFGTGGELATRLPESAGYFVLPLRVERHANGSVSKLSTSRPPVGLAPGTEIEVNLIVGQGADWFPTGWYAPLGETLDFSAPPTPVEDSLLVVESRPRGAAENEIRRTAYRLQASQRFLSGRPQIPEQITDSAP